MSSKLQQDDRVHKLFKNIASTSDGSVTSQLLFEFLGFIMGWKKSLKSDQYDFIKQLFTEKHMKIIENYEAKICHVQELNTHFVSKLKSNLIEMMQIYSGNPVKVAELQTQDKTLS